MLVCHHRAPRIAEPQTRALAALIGQVVSRLLETLGQARGRRSAARKRLDFEGLGRSDR